MPSYAGLVHTIPAMTPSISTLSDADPTDPGGNMVWSEGAIFNPVVIVLEESQVRDECIIKSGHDRSSGTN